MDQPTDRQGLLERCEDTSKKYRIVEKLFIFATKPRQPGFSSSINLEVVHLDLYRKLVVFFCEKKWTKCNNASWIHMHTTSKQIGLESPGCSGFEGNWKIFKSCATGTFLLNYFRSCMYMNPTCIFALVIFFLATCISYHSQHCKFLPP